MTKVFLTNKLAMFIVSSKHVYSSRRLSHVLTKTRCKFEHMREMIFQSIIYIM